jgi:bifunctional pyridoxal-dependent enzyme with beta-cystathionase and maltose regulon repressor activities
VAVDDLPFAVLGATVAALTTGQSWLDALLDTLKMRRRQLGGLIAAQLPDVPQQAVGFQKSAYSYDLGRRARHGRGA